MTPERRQWLQWRKGGIGSSDAPIVMGVSPYSTPRQLYEDKISPVVEEEETNFIMQKGNNLEPIARGKFAALYSIEHDVDEYFEPKLVTREDAPFLRASLDGCSVNGFEILEIKYQGAEVHQALIDHGHIPEKYWPQVQHALMVSGARVCHFVSINDDQDVRSVAVEPDHEYIRHLMWTEMKFWNHVLKRVPPLLIDGDFKSLRYKGAAEDARTYLSDREARQRLILAANNSGHKYIKMKGIRIINGIIKTEGEWENESSKY